MTRVGVQWGMGGEANVFPDGTSLEGKGFMNEKNLIQCNRKVRLGVVFVNKVSCLQTYS